MQGVILKALLAWAGIRAANHPVPQPIQRQANHLAHEIANREQAMFAGAQLVSKRSIVLSESMASDPADTLRIRTGLSDMHAIMAEMEKGGAHHAPKVSAIREMIGGVLRRLDETD